MKCILSMFVLILCAFAFQANAGETICGKIVYASDVIFEIQNGPASTLVVRLDARQLSSDSTLNEARADIESALRKPEYYSVCVETVISGYPKSNVFLYKSTMNRNEKRRGLGLAD